ncbi:GtrA family protein [Blastococcus sp. CT_GayMR20]|uniref:GtrA family protein n=1 Tax=Blastococcus sp. CT_GayMR20 TaxID=2559609 RepID=UPI0014322333|nr:GtrA family protein [Blastococcus sp. CT_GayMR20]
MSRSDNLRQALRFLLVGGLNTAVTVVLLAVLARVIDPSLAYSIVYAAGLVFTTVMTNRYVFSADRSWSRMAAFVAWYLAVYGVGLAVVHALDSTHRWSSLVLALATVAVTAPLSFLGGRLIFASATPPARAQEMSR